MSKSRKKIKKINRQYSKPQLSRWEQQRKTQRIITYTGIGIILAVLLLVFAGWYLTQAVPLNATVLVVNGSRYTVGDYVRLLTGLSKGQTASFVSNAAEEVLSLMEQYAIISQGAAQFNISVTDNEVKAEMAKRNPPLDREYFPVVRAQLLAKKITDNYFMSKIDKTAAQVNMQAIFSESQEAAAEVRELHDKGQSFNDLAASYSLDGYSKNQKGDIGWHPQSVFQLLLSSAVPGDYAFASSTDIGQISQPRPDDSKSKQIGYWIVKVLEKRATPSDQVHLQVILLGNEEEAIRAKGRLDSGEDFVAVAKEMSQMPDAQDNAGDIGWISSGGLSNVVEQFAFSADAGMVSQPITDTTQSTSGGFWLVKVLDKADEKNISDDDRSMLASNDFSQWFINARSSASVQTLLDDSRKSWAVERVAKGLGE